MELLDQRGEFGSRVIDVDYQEYAAAEAELGWLNSTFFIRSQHPFDLDALLLNIVGCLRKSFTEARAETAHLKVVGLGEEVCGVVNLVSNDSPPESSLRAWRSMREARLIVNARVAAEPAVLSANVRLAIGQSCTAFGMDSQEGPFQCFRPGQPMSQLHSISIGKM